MNSNQESLKEIINFRKELHKHPELSGNEKNTAQRIKHFIHKYNPNKIIKDIGGNGLQVIFEGENPGATIMFRADLDALPIEEESSFSYKSNHKNIAHSCGHDGHNAILINTIRLVSEDRPKNGKTVFLFQPAEEIGEGAIKVLNDPRFITPDYIFAIHNIPGFPEHQILLNKGVFAAASRGMIIKLTGKTSHASEPEMGVSPAIAMSEIIRFFAQLNEDKSTFSDLVLATVIHARLGEIAFGTSPGYAEVMVTLRSFKDSDMEKLIAFSREKINRISLEQNINNEISFVEEFPVTKNSPECIDILISIVKENNMDYQILNQPFKWSEDFGNFTKSIPGAFIGIGSGINHPNLHSPHYDFPDEIIHNASLFFFLIYKNILK